MKFSRYIHDSIVCEFYFDSIVSIDTVYISSVDMSSDSDSEEEINDLLKEAANCDYVNKLYSNISISPTKHSNDNASCKGKDIEESGLSSHQAFLAKRLLKIIDGLIKIEDIEPGRCTDKDVSASALGIQLLKDSVYIDDVEDEYDCRCTYKPHTGTLGNSLCVKDFEFRSKEAAVSPEWVMSQSNTALWKFFKPKIINMEAVKVSDGKVECVVVNSTY